MATIVRRIGNSIEIRHEDVPLFVPSRAKEAVARVMRQHLTLMLQDVAGFVSDEAPVGVSGALAQSFGGVVHATTSDGGLEILSGEIEDMRGRVFSSLPYAIVIDQGRTPGARMPPIDAIMLWVERVLGIKDGDDFELEEVSWAIARSIAKKGITARHFVQHGVDNAMPRIEAITAIMADAVAIALTTPETGGGGFQRGPISAPGGSGIL